METGQHPYNTRSKGLPALAETVRKTVDSPVEAIDAEVTNRMRVVSERTPQIPTHVLREGMESGADEEETSADESVRSEADSDRSSEWIESRSRATSPASSVPPSPRRRSGTEDQTAPRLVDASDSLRPLHQPPSRGGRSRAAPRIGSGAKRNSEATDPEDLAARSAQLIEQLQRFIQEREQALASPRNEPLICGDRRDPREAESRDGGRRGPVASHSFGTALADSGTRGQQFSDNGAQCGARTHDPEIKSLMLWGEIGDGSRREGQRDSGCRDQQQQQRRSRGQPDDLQP